MLSKRSHTLLFVVTIALASTVLGCGASDSSLPGVVVVDYTSATLSGDGVTTEYLLETPSGPRRLEVRADEASPQLVVRDGDGVELLRATREAARVTFATATARVAVSTVPAAVPRAIAEGLPSHVSELIDDVFIGGLPLPTDAPEAYLERVGFVRSGASGLSTVAAPIELPDEYGAAFLGQSGIPTTMGAGAKATVCVKMKNTGLAPWTRLNGFKLGSRSPQDNVTWGLNRIQLGAGDTIFKSSNKNFCFTITAPASPGTYAFQWGMLREGVTWFGAHSPKVMITVSAELAAAFVSQTVPTTLCPGDSFTAKLTFKNTGGLAWTRQLGVKAGTQSPQDNITFGSSRMALFSTDHVAPGKSYTFTYYGTAPSSPGNYAFQWRMLREGVAWFGQTSSLRSVKVVSCGDPVALDPQRTSALTWGQMTIGSWFGRKYFSVGGKRYIPKTDFLTAIAPGNNWKTDSTLFYLGHGVNKQQQMRNALVGSKYNSIYIYTLNQGDGNIPVTPYGTSGFSADVTKLNASRVKGWRAAIVQALQARLRPFIFLAADDSPAIKGMSASKWSIYVSHMVAAFGDLPVVWVVGLECDETMSYNVAKARTAAVKAHTGQLVGVHLTRGTSMDPGNPFRKLGDFAMLQFPTNKPVGSYPWWTAYYSHSDRPYIISEYNAYGTAKSKAIGTAIIHDANPAPFAGLGNGVTL